ncbi:hypothetical protein L1987_64377 [Smallanthus sonchifolius]|uniref:Uncharacterized protein n=1 Tax=Smallanthus sonchifolius TaxID=185202 RepID=A0ACB9CFX0_9ASTR|nr:hypothetical protein L1987_64377 [Smallanthus sonchifolius]
MAGEEEDHDNFSFPTTTCSPPRFIGSPRLWRSSSYSNSLHLHLKLTKQEHEEECKKINLLSYIKKKDGDENMDVIWEDLNYEEEICGGGRRVNDGGSCDFGREMPEWGKKGKKYREVGVEYGGRKRVSMVVVVNVLKKLLLLHHTSRHWTVKK